jgi:hypothetical protein
VRELEWLMDRMYPLDRLISNGSITISYSSLHTYLILMSCNVLLASWGISMRSLLRSLISNLAMDEFQLQERTNLSIRSINFLDGLWNVVSSRAR